MKISATQRVIWVVAVFGLCLSVQAKILVAASLDQKTYLLYEPIQLSISLQNDSGSDIDAAYMDS